MCIPLPFPLPTSYTYATLDAPTCSESSVFAQFSEIEFQKLNLFQIGVTELTSRRALAVGGDSQQMKSASKVETLPPREESFRDDGTTFKSRLFDKIPADYHCRTEGRNQFGLQRERGSTYCGLLRAWAYIQFVCQAAATTLGSEKLRSSIWLSRSEIVGPTQT